MLWMDSVIIAFFPFSASFGLEECKSDYDNLLEIHSNVTVANMIY